MKTVLSLVLCVFCFSGAVLADKSKENFSSGELKSLRNISQSILKVRTQERSIADEKAKPFREELKKLRHALRQAAAELKRDSMSIAPASVSYQAPTLTIDAQGKTTVSKQAAAPQKPVKEKINQKYSQRMSSARQSIANLQAMNDAQLSAAKSPSKTSNKKKLRIQKALLQLSADMDALEEGQEQGGGEKRRERLERLIARLDGPNAQNDKSRQDNETPTISTITKHYRK